ncbi:MAG: DUF3794 domain-containing protein [Sedimentibacter sp.]
MNSCMKNEIMDVVGLCDPSAFNLDLFPYWTQMSIPETLTIPEQKPDIEQINSINISVEIIRKKVIVTPISAAENEEGKNLSGNKLIVEGNLCQTISYTADVPEQSIHTAHFAVPFSAYIVIPATDDLNINYQVNPCVEDVFVLDVSKRQIFKNVTLLLQAVPAPISACPDEC